MTTASIFLAATLLQPVNGFTAADVNVLTVMQETEPITMLLMNSVLFGGFETGTDWTKRGDLPTPYCELDVDGYPKFTDWQPMQLDLAKLQSEFGR